MRHVSDASHHGQDHMKCSMLWILHLSGGRVGIVHSFDGLMDWCPPKLLSLEHVDVPHFHARCSHHTWQCFCHVHKAVGAPVSVAGCWTGLSQLSPASRIWCGVHGCFRAYSRHTSCIECWTGKTCGCFRAWAYSRHTSCIECWTWTMTSWSTRLRRVLLDLDHDFMEHKTEKSVVRQQCGETAVATMQLLLCAERKKSVCGFAKVTVAIRLVVPAWACLHGIGISLHIIWVIWSKHVVTRPLTKSWPSGRQVGLMIFLHSLPALQLLECQCRCTVPLWILLASELLIRSLALPLALSGGTSRSEPAVIFGSEGDDGWHAAWWTRRGKLVFCDHLKACACANTASQNAASQMATVTVSVSNSFHSILDSILSERLPDAFDHDWMILGPADSAVQLWDSDSDHDF